MTCPRCASTMFPCHALQHVGLADLSQDVLLEEPTFHCISCGNYEDRTILRNRAAQSALVAA